MINFFICLIISILLSFGFSILLVEKGNDFPIRKYRIYLQLLLRKIHWKAPQMLFCTVCSSFWVSAISDIVVCFISICCGCFYFFWPFSGFIAAGVSWIIIEYLNAIDKEQNINVFVEKEQ